MAKPIMVNDGGSTKKKQTYNVSRTETDASNLSGTDFINSAVGTSKAQPATKSNVLSGSPTKKETAKTSVPQTNLSASKKANTEAAKKSQTAEVKSALNKASDSSSKAGQNVLNTIKDIPNKVENFLQKYLTNDGVDSLPNDNKFKQFSQKLDSNFANDGTIGSSFITADSMAREMGKEADQRISTEKLLNGEESKGTTLSSQIDSALFGGTKLSKEEIDSLGGVVIDKRTGKQTDANYVNGLFETVNGGRDNINKAIEALNNDYRNGLISADDYVKLYDEQAKKWDSLQQSADELMNYEYKTGKDYYDWLKENGTEDEVRSFEEYVSSFDDSILESLVNSYKATLVDFGNRIPQLYDMIRAYNDEEYDFNDPNHLSNKMSEVANELRSYTLNGKNDQGIRKYGLQMISSLMPMINDAIIGTITGGALGVPDVGKFASAFTNIEMGTGSAAETMRKRLEEGNTVETSFWNAVAHGFITAMVEAGNVGNVTNIVNLFTGAGTNVLSTALFGLPNFGAMLYNMTKDGAGEAIEELAEYVADYFADNLTNLILNGRETVSTDVSPIPGRGAYGAIGEGGLTDQMIMAFGGAFILGLPTNVLMTINSTKKYNAAGEAVKYWKSAEAYYNSQNDVENAQLARSIADFIESERKPFEQTSQLGMAVQFEDDIPSPAPSIDDTMNIVANAFKLDVDDQFMAYEQNMNQMNELTTMLGDSMAQRGINMSLNDYVDLNSQERTEFKKLSKFFNDNEINSGFGKLMPGQNGMSVGDGIILNTDQSRTIDIDALADLDRETYRNAMTTDRNAIFKEAGADASATTSAAHEITHYAERSGLWNNLRDMVKEMMGEERFNTAVKRLNSIYAQRGVYDADAEHEAVAFFIQKNLGNMNFLESLARTNGSLLGRLYSSAKALFSGDSMTKLENIFEKALYDAQQNALAQGTPSYSIGTVFQAVDMTIQKNGNKVEAYIGGEKVNEVSFDNVKDSPMGRLMDMSVDKGFITREEADDQMQMYADMCNLILRTKDPDLVWAITGSIGYQRVQNGADLNETNDTAHAAFTSNADKQYSRTFDVTTICNKTQQVVDVMSQAMMRLGRGLSEDEIVKIVYDEVNKQKEPVPCPVCYVFSRWVGVGGLLDNIKNYQKEYANVDVKELQKRYDALSKQVDAIAKKENIRGTKARDVVEKTLNEEYNALVSKENIARLAGEKLSKKDSDRLESLKQDIDIMNRWSWIGNVRLSNNYKPVPDNILFDMNKGEEFANDYPETWSYRTTRGPAMGKAITPYSSEVLGQTIIGFAGTPNNMRTLGKKRGEKNAFLKEASKQRDNTYSRAIKNARAQNLIGGSRAQSTSDFRFEYVLDYLLHFLELQSINSYGQTYTKVPEAVPMLASVGYETNLSLMPKGFGFKQVKKGTKGALELDGKYYTLEFSSLTGMNHEDAFRLSATYDEAQPIMVGINDEHIRLCMKDDRITFIIPYHASGSTEERYLSMMKSVGEEVPAEARKDYSKIQTDVAREDATTEQKTLRKIRMDIITGKGNNLAQREMDLIRGNERKGIKGNEILSNLYDRFYVEGVDPDCYRNFLKKDQAETIFPYEYWDKTTTFETADINGERFVQYCNDLGLTPRFEKFSKYPGYWKMLIDRSMYNNDGTYHVQKAINLDNFNTDFLYKDKMVEGVIQPSKMFDRTKTEEITNAVLERIENGEAIVDIDNPEYFTMKNLLKISPREMKTFEDINPRSGVDVVSLARDNIKNIEGSRVGISEDGNEKLYVTNDISNKESYFSNNSISTGNINEPGTATAMANIGELYKGAVPLNKTEYVGGKQSRAGQKFTIFFNEFRAGGKTYLARILIQDANPQTSNFERKLHKYRTDEIPEASVEIEEVKGGENKNEAPAYLDQIQATETSNFSIEKLIDDVNNSKWQEELPNEIIVSKNGHERIESEKGKDFAKQYSLGEEIVPNDDGGNNVVPPTKVQSEVVDGYAPRKKQQFRESNLEKSTVLNEEQKQRTRDISAEGGFSYQSLINKVEVQRAREYMERDGVDATFNKFMDNNSPSVKSAIMGEVLLEKLAKDNDPRWEDVAIKLADDATILGQGLQAYAILQRMSPQGQLVAVRRNMDRMQADLNERYGKNAPQLELKPELEQELMDAQTPEERQKVRDKIQKDLIEQMPITFTDMLNSWRYLAMLGNPRTHVRNFFGNAFFMPAIGLKNTIGRVLEKVANTDIKTKAFASRFNPNDKAYFDAAEKAFEQYDALMSSQEKYEQKGFTEKTLLGKGLNKLDEWNSQALNAEDKFFSKGRFELSYAQFLKANNLDPNNISPEMEARAVAYATNESLKATYRDANAYATWLNKLETDPKLKTLGFFKKAILPFTKTPFNIVRRGVEYSGIGLIKSIYDGATKVRNGTMDVNTWLDEMASGMSGVAIMGLGYLLKQLGIFRTKDDDKDRKKYYDAELGEQDYAIDLDNGTYTIDWMSPVIMPLAIGADFAEAFDELGNIEDADSGLNAMLSIFSNIADPIVETSMLSSLKDALSSYSREGSAYFGDVITSAIASAIGQFFPTIGGQIARTIDDTRRTTSPNKGLVDKTIRQIRNKLPYLGKYLSRLPNSKQNEPYINKRGEEEKTEGGNWVGRAFLNMFSPGYYSSKDADKYDDELYRLYDATDDINVLPSSTIKSFSYDGENYKLYGSDYTELQRTMYRTESEYVNQFMDSNAYKNLDDAERVKTIDDIRKYARDVAKREYLESQGKDYENKSLDKAQTALDNGIELYQYYDYLNNAGTKQADKMKYLEDSGFTEKEKEALWNMEGYKTSYEAYYAKNMGKSSGKSSSTKSSSSGSKSSSVTSSKVKVGTSSGGTKLQAKAPLTQKSENRVVNNYLKAYSSSMNSRKPSASSGQTVVCPKCRNRVTPYNGRCPVCGNPL